MSTVIIAGALANKYRNGGGTWERLSWVLGLRRLGFDVYFIEQITPEACFDAAGTMTAFEESVNLRWFQSVTRWFSVADNSSLIYDGGAKCAGLSWQRLLELAESAELLVNLSGHLTLVPLLERIRCKAYVDVDPGFTQFWHTDPDMPFQIAPHDLYFTIGENIGAVNCSIPTAGIEWLPTRQPVVLDDWPIVAGSSHDRFTTIASWRGPYGPIEVDGKRLGLKVHEFRKFIELPRRATAAFEIALNIHPAEQRDLEALHLNGWRIVDPQVVADTPDKFRRYVQGSSGECTVAQGVYVDTNSGWFSDRTVRYLASGKPVLVQDTGFGRNIPAGEGLLTFRTLDEAAAAAEDIVLNYEQHCRAARAVAHAYFDSDKVLSHFMEEVGCVSKA